MQPNEPFLITKHELDSIVEDAVERGVKKTLLLLGVDTSNPIEVQKDFAYIRNVRIGSSSTRVAVMGGFIASGVAGLGTLLYFGIQFFINLVTHNSPPPPPVG